MAQPSGETPERFTIICGNCSRALLARQEWVGRDVQCPHCTSHLAVPERPADGQPVRANVSMSATLNRFSFACPRCQSVLESHAGMGGQTGRCPTCNAQFVVPPFTPAGAPVRARLLDGDQQDPTPMHAYAASGHQAPRICRRTDGGLAIECPRCQTLCDVALNNCPGCGTPFTIEGVPTTAGRPGHALAVTALVLGILSVPMFFLVVLGPLAIVFGLASWLRCAQTRPPGPAFAGLLTGTAGSLVSLGMF